MPDSRYVRSLDHDAINNAIEALGALVSDSGGRGNEALAVLKKAVGW